MSGVDSAFIRVFVDSYNLVPIKKCEENVHMLIYIIY